MTGPGTPTSLAECAVANAPIPLLELDTWRSLGLRAGITARDGNFDLGLFADGRAGAVMENWLNFSAYHRAGFRAVAVARQVHGSRIGHHLDPTTGLQLSSGVDGHLTTQPGLLLTITVADCVPVYLAHPRSGTLALLHAGWKGIAAGILESGIAEILTFMGAPSHELVMHCGVGICGNCYEVGHEVIAAVCGKGSPESRRLDLRAALADRARRLGVREISVSTWCSSHDMDLFFSHRRSRGSDGRMVAYLGVPVVGDG